MALHYPIEDSHFPQLKDKKKQKNSLSITVTQNNSPRNLCFLPSKSSLFNVTPKKNKLSTSSKLSSLLQKNQHVTLSHSSLSLYHSSYNIHLITPLRSPSLVSQTQKKCAPTSTTTSSPASTAPPALPYGVLPVCSRLQTAAGRRAFAPMYIIAIICRLGTARIVNLGLGAGVGGAECRR